MKPILQSILLFLLYILCFMKDCVCGSVLRSVEYSSNGSLPDRVFELRGSLHSLQMEVAHALSDAQKRFNDVLRVACNTDEGYGEQAHPACCHYATMTRNSRQRIKAGEKWPTAPQSHTQEGLSSMASVTVGPSVVTKNSADGVKCRKQGSDERTDLKMPSTGGSTVALSPYLVEMNSSMLRSYRSMVHCLQFSSMYTYKVCDVSSLSESNRNTLSNTRAKVADSNYSKNVYHFVLFGPDFAYVGHQDYPFHPQQGYIEKSFLEQMRLLLASSELLPKELAKYSPTPSKTVPANQSVIESFWLRLAIALCTISSGLLLTRIGIALTVEE